MAVVILIIISIAVGRLIILGFNDFSMKFLGVSMKFISTKERFRSIVICSIVVFIILYMISVGLEIV